MTPEETTGYTWLFYVINAVVWGGLGMFFGVMYERITKIKNLTITIEKEAP